MIARTRRIGAACAMARARLALGAAATLAGCAAGSYAGIPLGPGAGDGELRDLAIRARSGDEQAQLELGIRFEEGRGVPVDLRRARRLYFDAATRPSRERIAIYIPTRGGVVPGFVRLLPPALEFSGLDEALVRWHRLRDRRGAGRARKEGADGDSSARSDGAAASPPPPSADDRDRALRRTAVHGYAAMFNLFRSGGGGAGAALRPPTPNWR